jgi:hypothetical protein
MKYLISRFTSRTCCSFWSPSLYREQKNEHQPLLKRSTFLANVSRVRLQGNAGRRLTKMTACEHLRRNRDTAAEVKSFSTS